MSGFHYLGVFGDSSDFSCSGSTCRTDQPRVKASFKQLQRMINGVMHITKGSKIGVDGVIGSNTVKALARALNEVQGLKATYGSPEQYASFVREFVFSPTAKTAARNAWELGMYLHGYVAHLPKNAFAGGVAAKAKAALDAALPKVPASFGGDYTKYGLLGIIGYLAYKKFKK